MKRLLIIWVVAIFGIVTVPAVSYVVADSPSTDDLQGPEEDFPSDSALSDTQFTAERYGDAFVKWCIADGYGAVDCRRARIDYQDQLHWWLALQLDYSRGYDQARTFQQNPADRYWDWYPGGAYGPTPSQPVPAPGTIHPGQVPSPMPPEPTRSPSVRCGCHINMWWTS